MKCLHQRKTKAVVTSTYNGQQGDLQGCLKRLLWKAFKHSEEIPAEN